MNGRLSNGVLEKKWYGAVERSSKVNIECSKQHAYVKRIFSCIKDVSTDRRHGKLSYDTIQRLALSKLAVNYEHLPLEQIEGQFLNN